jgi:hypothetical protein
VKVRCPDIITVSKILNAAVSSTVGSNFAFKAFFNIFTPEVEITSSLDY